MNFEDRACRFDCHGDWLYGVLSIPEQLRSRGVLIVVGGPQYRSGSHRQLTLLARALAADGIPVMRFDYRGMGDSEGEARDFENIDDDLRCAIDHFMQAVPGMRELAIWGLCDAASAALFYAYRDSRVTGLVLVNPWVRTETGMAKTYLRHYYGARLLAPELWRKILQGRFDYLAAGRSLLRLLRAAWLKKPAQAALVRSLPDRMLDGYTRFQGKVLLILSGNDYTAKEFSDLTAASSAWAALMTDGRTRRLELAGANHTFSTQDDRRQVALWISEWLNSPSST
jgi:exosortase A-associated hydrolase 1